MTEASLELLLIMSYCLYSSSDSLMERGSHLRWEAFSSSSCRFIAGEESVLLLDSQIYHQVYSHMQLTQVSQFLLCLPYSCLRSSTFLVQKYLEMAYDSKGVLRLSRIISRFPGPAEHDQLDLKAPLTSSSPPGVHVALVPLPSMKRLASGPRPAGSYEIEDELEGEDSIDDSEAPLLPPSTLNERLWLSLPDGEQRKLELPRISTLAVFHKASSSAVGVPRSFYAFLRRWPSVPRVVVSKDLIPRRSM